MFKQVISLLISICIIGQSGSAYAMQTPQQQREEFIDYLKEEQERYKTLFDQEALLDALDYDADNIIDFVSNKVVYQAYDGVLRGAKGTLIGRAGNSHDQAITLAGMLNDAGLEAEILVGKLTAEQATELNLTITSPQFSELKNTIASSNSIIAKNISAEAEKLAKTSGESISEIMKETNALAERVFEQIPKEQLKKGVEAFKGSVQDSAISYRWVRYRLAQGEKWVEVHPAYADASKWNLTTESVEKNTVNPDHLQQFSVEVWIENSAGEKHSVTGKWKKPVVNLLDHTLSIEFGSDAMTKSDLWNKPDAMFKQSHFFFIQIDGKLPKEGKLFDFNGNIYSAESLSGLNSVFSALNKKTQKAADSLSGLNFNDKTKASNNKQLVKVWLEFTLDKPNAESKNIKRVIFEGKALSDTSKTAMRLLQRWDIDVMTTIPMQQYYQNNKTRQLAATLEGVDKFQEYFKNKPNAKREEIVEVYGLAMGNPNRGLLTHKRSLFDRFKTKRNIVNYPNEPNLLAVRQGMNYSDKGWSLYEMTDIIANQHWTLDKLKHDGLSPMILENIRRGVWQTRMESARLVEPSNTAFTGSAFTKLKQANVYSDKVLGSKLNLYDQSQSAWWDIDLQTGSTVGMMDLGFGVGGADISDAALFEYIAWGITGAFTVVGSATCINGGGDILCCIGLNVVVAFTGAVLGWLLGALAVFSSVALSTISVGVDLGATYIPIKCD